MEFDLRDNLGNILVLDIESAPDPHSVALSGRRGRVGETPAALHLITDVSMLRATEAANGTWSGVRLSSVADGQADEEKLLRAVDTELAALWRRDGTLVTYNGRHDVAVLVRRCARHLMFDTSGIGCAPDHTQIDMMLMRTGGGGRLESLKSVAAGLGIPTAHQLPGRGMRAPSPGVAKSQTDVAMTFIVMLYELSMRRRDARAVREGWQALGRHIADMGPHGEHLAQFRRHPLGQPPSER